MAPHKRTPAQKEKDKLYRRAVNQKAKEEIVKASTRKKKHALSQQKYKLRLKNGITTAPRMNRTTSLFGSEPSASFSFSFADKVCCTTPTPRRMDPSINAPKTAPPAMAMTPSQSYHLEVMKLQSQLYENTNAKLAMGFDTVTALAEQLRLNCKEGVDALGANITKVEQEQE
jgi:hypothetical protein